MSFIVRLTLDIIMKMKHNYGMALLLFDAVSGIVNRVSDVLVAPLFV